MCGRVHDILTSVVANAVVFQRRPCYHEDVEVRITYVSCIIQIRPILVPAFSRVVILSG